MAVNITITPKQMEVLNSESIITLFSAGRGCGKTAIMSLIAIFALVQNKRVLVIGPVYQQLKKSNFWQTLKFLNIMKIPYKINRSELTIFNGRGGEIIHLSGEEPESIRSYTSIDVLILDEAGSLSEDCWTIAIPTMRDTKDGNVKVYVVGTPPANEHHWVVRLNKRDDVKTIFGSYKDNPYCSEQTINLITKEYEHYPDDFKRRELFGEFIFTSSGESLFDGFLIEKNNAYTVKSDDPIECGLDIAGPGRDMTCAVIRQNFQVLGVHIRKTTNEIELKKFVKEIYLIYGFNVLRYDSTGLGAMLVFDLPLTVLSIPVNFGSAGGDRFENARSAMFFNLRRKNGVFMSDNTYNEHGENLLVELKATLIKTKENKKLGVILKEDIKKRIGRSPDRADALALAFCQNVKETKKSVPHIAPLVFGR